MTEQEVQDCTILRCIAGSRLLGLENEDSDTDRLGVCVEPLKEAMGVGAPFEQWVQEKSQTTIYGLRKWMRLALKGNPTILLPLWAPPEALETCDAVGQGLQALASLIVSRRAAGPFLGYLQAQKQRLTGERGQMRVHRPDLVEKFGFDTKYAMHMLRLGLQGVELLEEGSLALPMRPSDRAYLRGVRNGEYTLQDCLTRAGELEADLKELATSSHLREEPDVQACEDWMTRVYFRTWSASRSVQDSLEDARLLEAAKR